ncbi:MAG: hypothetical protein B6D38_03660 [Anaerolineae bacterium UTCFX1]|jgi:hypothetical protein|nr:MAG: hypothetical protein B6D38_03660 [Anaerolineae bacterium UTCFX1]
MTIIHMDPEQVRSVGRQLKQTTDVIFDEIERLPRRVRAIPWQSPGRDRFVNEVEQLKKQIQVVAQQGLELSQRVQAEVDEWEEVAASFGAVGAGAVAISSGVGTGAESPSTNQPPKNMQELAKMVQDLYIRDEKGNYTPIRVIQIGPNEYLMLIAGTQRGQDANNWNSAVRSGLGLPGDYLKQCKSIALTLPVGAVINFAGHSQGGMMGNQLAADPEVQEHLKVKSVTTFGSPVNAKPQDNVVYKRYAAKGDVVPLGSNEVLDVLNPLNNRDKEIQDLEQHEIPGDKDLKKAHDIYGESEALKSEALPFEINQWNNSTSYNPEQATGSLPILDSKPEKMLSSGGGSW